MNLRLLIDLKGHLDHLNLRYPRSLKYLMNHLFHLNLKYLMNHLNLMTLMFLKNHLFH